MWIVNLYHGIFYGVAKCECKISLFKKVTSLVVFIMLFGNHKTF